MPVLTSYCLPALQRGMPCAFLPARSYLPHLPCKRSDLMLLTPAVPGSAGLPCAAFYHHSSTCPCLPATPLPISDHHYYLFNAAARRGFTPHTHYTYPPTTHTHPPPHPTPWTWHYAHSSSTVPCYFSSAVMPLFFVPALLPAHYHPPPGFPTHRTSFTLPWFSILVLFPLCYLAALLYQFIATTRYDTRSTLYACLHIPHLPAPFRYLCYFISLYTPPAFYPARHLLL